MEAGAGVRGASAGRDALARSPPCCSARSLIGVGVGVGCAPAVAGASRAGRRRGARAAVRRAGDVGGGRPAGAGDRHAARPDRPAVLAGLAARAHRSRSCSSTRTASRSARSRGARWRPPSARCRAAQRPVLVVVSVNPLDTPASARAAITRVGPRRGRAVALADGHAGPARPGLARVPHLRRARRRATSPTPRRST